MHNFLSLWLLVLLSVSATSVRAEERWNEPLRSNLLKSLKLREAHLEGDTSYRAPLAATIGGLGVGLIAPGFIPERFRKTSRAVLAAGMTTAAVGFLQTREAIATEWFHNSSGGSRYRQGIFTAVDLMEVAIAGVLMPDGTANDRDQFSEDTAEVSYPHWADALAAQMVADEPVAHALRNLCFGIHSDLARASNELPSPAAWRASFEKSFAHNKEAFMASCIVEMRKALVTSTEAPARN